MERKRRPMSPEALEELGRMAENFAPLPDPKTEEERRQERLRQAELLDLSRQEAEKYRRRHLPRGGRGRSPTP